MQTHKDRNEYTGRDKIVTKRRFTAMLLFFVLKLIFDRQNNEHKKKKKNNRINSNEIELQKKIHHS
jgi:hypothetical protein